MSALITKAFSQLRGGLSGGQGVALLEQLKKQVPTLADEVVVTVRGQPGATKRQLYYLALSTAFGIIRRFDLGVGNLFVAVPPGALICEYDAAENWVQVTVQFNTSLLTTAVTTGITSIGELVGITGEQFAGAVDAYLRETEANNNRLGYYAEAVVFSGPKEDVVGGPFNFTGALTPAVPSTPRSTGAPNLPFEKRMILTTAPVVKEPIPQPYQSNISTPTPNPKPPGDNRSRGTIPLETKSVNDTTRGLTFRDGDGFDMIRLLIPMVYSALAEDGTQQRFTNPIPGPAGG